MILAHYMARRACVYVRQSSWARVKHHLESGLRQLDFQGRTVPLGCEPEQVQGGSPNAARALAVC